MKQKQYQKMNWAEIESIIYSDCSHPFEILGPHTMGKETLLQAFFPYAKSVKVCFDDKTNDVIEMEEVEEEGFFAVFFPNRKKLSYHYEVTASSGEVLQLQDAYAFPTQLSAKETVAFFKGVDDRADRLFVPKEVINDGVKGVQFSVYAPNAVRVSVIGPFNHFDGRVNPMEKDDKNGIFTLFIPGLSDSTEYCYELKKKNGDVLVRRDPYALGYGQAHRASCLVKAPSAFAWKDNDWMEKRKERKECNKVLNICSVSVEEIPRGVGEEFEKSCKIFLSNLRKMQYSHVNIIGLWESVEKKAYPMKGLLAISKCLLEQDALKKFINLCHKNNIGVLTDWAIAYFGNDESGLAYFDGTHLYEHADARKGYHSYFDACLYQYKAPHVKSLLYTALRVLLEEFHFDGIVWVDVASMLYLDYGKSEGEWICNEQGGNCNFEAVSLIREMNAYLENYDKGLISIAQIDAVWSQVTKMAGEESLGFDYVENQGIADTLISFITSDVYQRRTAAYDVIRQAKFAFCEGFVLPDKWCNAATLNAFASPEEHIAAMKFLYAFTTFYPGKKMKLNNKSLFETSESLLDTIAMCNRVYATTPLLYENDMNAESLFFIETADSPSSVLSFWRKGGMDDEILLVVANASGEDCMGMTVAAPFAGKYKAVFTTDETCKITWNATNEVECNKLEQSFVFDMPAWSVTVFSYRAFTEKELAQIAEKKRKAMILEIKNERARIEKERDCIIAEAIREATLKINEIEKKLKELE